MKGILLISLAVMLFASSDVIGKHLYILYAVPWVMAVRGLVNLLLLMKFLAPRRGRALVQTHRTGLVALRGLCLPGASLSIAVELRAHFDKAQINKAQINKA